MVKADNGFSIDVIIPVYNGELYIKETIESVKNQTYLPNQIIIVDDGSTDNTSEIIQNCIDNNSVKINYIKKINGGLSSARNEGIKHSKSKYLAFVDADDVWENDKLEKQIKVFNKSILKTLGIVYCDHIDIDENNNPINTSYLKLDKQVKGWIFEILLTGNKISSSGSGVLIKKECFDKIGLFDESLSSAEDWDMWLRIAKVYQFDYVDEKLVKIRRHTQSMSRNSNRMHIGYLNVLEKWLNFIQKEPRLIYEYQNILVRDIFYELPSTNLFLVIKNNASEELYKILFGNYLLEIQIGLQVLKERIARALKHKVILKLFRSN